MSDATNPAPMKILVVDDNYDAAESLQMLLALWGHEVEVANDGPAALAAASHYRPDVVLLDIGLPGMDGYEVSRRLRQQLGAAPVHLAITGYGQTADRARSSEAGFDGYLVKPVDPEALRTLLQEHRQRPRPPSTP